MILQDRILTTTKMRMWPSVKALREWTKLTTVVSTRIKSANLKLMPSTWASITHVMSINNKNTTSTMIRKSQLRMILKNLDSRSIKFNTAFWKISRPILTRESLIRKRSITPAVYFLTEEKAYNQIKKSLSRGHRPWLKNSAKTVYRALVSLLGHISTP